MNKNNDIEQFRTQLIKELIKMDVDGDYTGNAEQGSWWESDAEGTKEKLIEIVKNFTYEKNAN